MGEAAQRGTKEERVSDAIKRDSQKLVWMVIESSLTGEDDSIWTPVMPEDLPEWVKNPEVIGKIRNGEKVSMNPDKGTVWYRGVRCDKPTMN